MTTKISSDNIQAATLQTLAGGGGTEVYQTIASLPLSNVNDGDLAFVAENNRLYMWSGTGWYNIALLNTNPTITEGPNPSYLFAIDGTPIVLTLTANDPEGIPITWSYQVTSGTLGDTATIIQSNNVFTITPSTSEEDVGSFQITFTASDGVNIATAVSSFTLAFAAADQLYNQSIVVTTSNVNEGNNNTFVDSSTNNLVITRNGNVTQGTFSPFSPAGWSGYFDGSGDFLTIGSNANLALGANDWTVEMWVYPTSVTVSQNIMIDWRSTNNDLPVLYMVNNQVWWRSESTTRIISSSTLVTDTWYHIAVVRSATTTTMYIDGLPVGSYTDTVNYENSDLKIGKAWDSNHWNGYISNVRIVKGTAIYTSNFIPPISPLGAVSGTSLLTLQDNRFKDNSTNNFTITRNGDTRITAFSPFLPQTSYDASVHGGSAYFDGTGNYLSMPSTSGVFGTENFTIDLWIYPRLLANMVIIDTRAANDSAIGWTLHLRADNTLQFSEGSVPIVTSPSAVDVNAWSHIAVCRVGNTFTLYINGVNSVTGTSANAINPSALFHIGFKSFSATALVAFNGYMSNLRIVTGTALYTNTFTPPTAPSTAVIDTSLLLNFTNSNIYDEAGKIVLETVGNAKVSTSVVKYGDGSMYFNGADYIAAPLNEPEFGFGTGDFTVEMWLRCTDSAAALFFDTRRQTENKLNLSMQSGTGIRVGVGTADVIISSTGIFDIDTWVYVAVTKASGSYRLFINGIQVGSTVTNTTDLGTTGSFCLGTAGDVRGDNRYDYHGYLSDVRVTKGHARYTANFTPPTAKLGFDNAE
jgi:hypothetical protein